MRILKLTRSVEKKLLAAREGRDREATRIAERIVADERKRGDEALFAWAIKLYGPEMVREGVWISSKDLRRAEKDADAEYLRAVQHAAANVRKVAEKQLPKEWSIEVEPGVKIGQMVRPIDAVGCYIPGGRYALVSTLVMTVVPAQVAGVKRIVVVCPKPNQELLGGGACAGNFGDCPCWWSAGDCGAGVVGTPSILPVDKILAREIAL